MSKLVRAQVKAAELLPEWAKCCDNVLRLSGVTIVLDMDTVRISHAGICKSCGAPWPQTTWATDINTGGGKDLELLDLDEGPLDEPQAGAGS